MRKTARGDCREHLKYPWQYTAIPLAYQDLGPLWPLYIVEMRWDDLTLRVRLAATRRSTDLVMSLLNAAIPAHDGAYVGISAIAKEGSFVSITGERQMYHGDIKYTRRPTCCIGFGSTPNLCQRHNHSTWLLTITYSFVKVTCQVTDKLDMAKNGCFVTVTG
jgi:hypothetical protein